MIFKAQETESIKNHKSNHGCSYHPAITGNHEKTSTRIKLDEKVGLRKRIQHVEERNKSMRENDVGAEKNLIL